MKKVQVGRSRMAEEMARPTWEAPSAPVSIHKKKETAPKQPQKVEKINAPAPVTQRKLRVAAYARVSTDLDSQETSIENQCDHYKSLIASKPHLGAGGHLCGKRRQRYEGGHEAGAAKAHAGL